MFLREHAGVHYRKLLQVIAERKAIRSYLEIGVRDGANISVFDCPSIGVDPNFVIKHNVQGKKQQLHLYQMTSDAFFRDFDPRVILGRPIDMIFLDGLHQFEYLLRDFINAEKISHPGSVIVIDDCLPVNSEMIERNHNNDAREDRQHANWWTGDVWKIIPMLKQYRPDLKLIATDTVPTGSVCVSRLDPQSSVLERNYDDIVEQALKIPQTDDELTQFYATYPPMSSRELIRDFEASLYVGA